MIVVWGRRDDEPAVAVARELAARGAEHLFLDHDQAGRVRLTGVDGAARDRLDLQASGQLDVDGRRIRLAEVTAWYMRCSVRPGDPPEAVALWSSLVQHLDRASGLVVNRPSAMAANDSKPWQARQLQSCGLPGPATLVTNDPEHLNAFLAQHERVAFKSTSGLRSVVCELDHADAGRLATLPTCPTQFQELVTGVNHRVHVVGSSVFVATITSNVLDYRYAGRSGGSTTMTAGRLPAAVERSCRRAAHEGGLSVAGIDLIHAFDGRWLCFEMNPSPAFTWFAEQTGHLIAGAVADLLMHPDPHPHPTEGEQP
jgi:glutathione synthase/RimK-type ligase-like ATP-grasp enzyme